MINIRDTSTWHTASLVYIHTGSGQWPQARGMWVYDGAQWRKGFPAPTSQSNWVDPEGSNDGQNVVLTNAGLVSVPVNDRLRIDLNSPYSSNLGYAMNFRLQGINDFTATDAIVSAQIAVVADGTEYFLTNTQIFLTTPGQNVSQTHVSVSFQSNATGSLRVRPILTVNSTGGTGFTQGILSMYATSWGSDNYSVYWE